MRVWEAGLVVATLIATSKASAAERPTVALRYSIADGASACSNEATLRGRVTEEVGYDPFVSGAARSLVIEISHDKLFMARVVDRAPSGAEAVRTLTSSVSCDDLLQSVVLAVAVSLDPEVQPKAVAEAPPEKQPEVKLVPVLVPVYVDRPAAPPPKPVLRDVVGGYVSAGFGVGGGFVPGSSLGPTVSAGIRRKYWEISLEGSAELPGTTETQFGEIEVFSLLATVAPCYTPPLSSWGRALVCGNLSIGGAFASAKAVVNPTDSVEVAAFTGPRGGFAFNVAPHFEVRVLGDLLLNLAPIEAQVLSFGNAETVYDGAPIAGRVVTAMAVTFP
jgi:hypothetical protein